ncbi:hypothetical protein [Globicatella sanguinis]
MSDLILRLIEIEHKLEKFSQINAYLLKAQWLSGLKLRLNEMNINLKNSVKLVLIH